MAAPEFVYSALNLPTLASFPSTNCLQWSGDGQVCIVTKTAVHILTPDPGINVDTFSVTHACVSNAGHPKEKPLGWFRTMIEFNKAQAYNWPTLSQDWAAVSLGSLDVTLRAAACSPSHLTRDAGCVIATLSSNMDLSLWTATKNHLKGEWIKVHDITHSLVDWFSRQKKEPTIVQTLQAQTTCIAWSSQPNFGVVPTPVIDGSLLVAGNRAGSLTFMRFDGRAVVRLVDLITVAESWITHLAISSWVLIETGKCEAYLAYGVSDGSIGLVKIVQSLQRLASDSFELDYSVEAVFEVQNYFPYNADKRGITALVWVEVPGKGRILVHCKPGVVHLWCPYAAVFGWSGHRVLFLEAQKLSVGSSVLHPVSGVQYVRSQDALIICLFGGSFHVIHNLSLEPSWSAANDSTLTTENLSVSSRSVFTRVENEETQFTDVNRISGMLSYDGSATLLWLHEACQPSDFSYKHDAQHNSKFVMTQLQDDVNDDTVIQELAEGIGIAPTTILGHSPNHSLRTVFLYLRKRGTVSRLHPRLLEILQLPLLDTSANVGVPVWPSELTQGLRNELRQSLKTHLFGWDDLSSLRLRLAVADFCWQHYSEDKQKQEECGQVAQKILNAISHRVLRTVLRHILGLVKVLSSNDAPFVARIVAQSLLPGVPPDLSHEAKNVLAEMNAAVPSVAESLSISSNEQCPACQTEISLQDITNAVCLNGHTWVRCSITLFILSSPMVRTCLGCSRKAFLPFSSDNASDNHGWVPRAARSWIVEELLEAVHRCLFCGNRFVKIL